MPIIKETKDYLLKILQGPKLVPAGLFELAEYFRHNGSILFEYTKSEGLTIAKSTDFRHGAIITSGKNQEELDKNIKDAILTSFEIPSAYAKEARLYKTGDQQIKAMIAARIRL